MGLHVLVGGTPGRVGVVGARDGSRCVAGVGEMGVWGSCGGDDRDKPAHCLTGLDWGEVRGSWGTEFKGAALSGPCKWILIGTGCWLGSVPREHRRLRSWLTIRPLPPAPLADRPTIQIEGGVTTCREQAGGHSHCV